jgi:SAM-dependent methyltransferase
MKRKLLTPGFGEENLKLLNSIQKEQVFAQWKEQQHDDLRMDLEITPFGEVLKGFAVKKGVWNPAIVSARHHAAYLYYHSDLFRGKDVIDIGCGTGLMGIVMAKYGAKNVLMSDLSEKAVANTRQNIKHFGLTNAKAVVGNLFGSIMTKADCITFMLPYFAYFAGDSPEDDTIAASMLASPDVLRRFLNNAHGHLNPDGVIVAPSFSLAGDRNNPAIMGREYCYDIITPFMAESTTGLQRGTIAMHELRARK